MSQNIELHIEELVLHGFSGYNAYRIGEAVQLEITRLLQERGLPAAFSAATNVERLNAGSFDIHTDTKAEAVGSNIANSVYKGLTK